VVHHPNHSDWLDFVRPLTELFFPYEFKVPVTSAILDVDFLLTGTFNSTMTATGVMDVSSLIVVPEPSGVALLGLGSVLALIGLRRRRVRTR